MKPADKDEGDILSGCAFLIVEESMTLTAGLCVSLNSGMYSTV